MLLVKLQTLELIQVLPSISANLKNNHEYFFPSSIFHLADRIYFAIIPRWGSEIFNFHFWSEWHGRYFCVNTAYCRVCGLDVDAFYFIFKTGSKFLLSILHISSFTTTHLCWWNKFHLEINRCKIDYWKKSRCKNCKKYTKMAHLCLGNFLQILFIMRSEYTVCYLHVEYSYFHFNRIWLCVAHEHLISVSESLIDNSFP